MCGTERANGAAPGAFPSLTTLTLDRNDLTTLPAQIGSISTLENISLRQNKISLLPSSVWRLQKLKVAHLEDNLIIRLPGTSYATSAYLLRNLQYFLVFFLGIPVLLCSVSCYGGTGTGTGGVCRVLPSLLLLTSRVWCYQPTWARLLRGTQPETRYKCSATCLGRW